MLSGLELLDVLNAAPLRPLLGPFHRYVQHRFIASALARGTALHILSGEWARKTGGRFNFPGRFRTTYLSLDPETARVEAERIDAPFIHIPILGTLQQVLRLDDPAISSLVQISQHELQVEWRLANARGIEVATQQLGQAAYNTGRIEGIAYPSTVNSGGICLAVFSDGLMPGSSLEVQDPEAVIHERISG